MNFSLFIVHFQPIEKYPPILNYLNFLAENNNFKNVYVITTKSTLKIPLYKNQKTNVIRFPAINGNKIARLIRYLYFYLGSLFILLVKNPKKVLYYETLSSFSPIIYFYISLKTIHLYIHYHEYETPEEIKSGMAMSRIFHNLFEIKIYKNAKWLSHTNEQRMNLFLKDNPFINKSITRIMPNYPPRSWANFDIKRNIEMPVRFVYVGSFASFDTLYIREFINWIKKKNGNALLDIYSFYIPPEISNFINNQKCKFISLKGSVSYYQLPMILNQYDIGVILYKGTTLNFIFNAPNKLFEYLLCGLDVWVSNKMEGCRPYGVSGIYPKVTMIDFENIDTVKLQEIISRNELNYKPSEYYCEPVYSILTNSIADAKR
jgi:hypothetical protein